MTALRALMKTAVFLVFCLSCVEKEFDPNDPAASYAIAKEPYDEENYEIALQKLGEFKSRFPYSQYAIEAELLIANSYFELGQYTEAALAYAQFAKLHPSHPKVDYSLFRVGESYWQQSPEEVDREQEYTEKAVAEWRKLLELKPDSAFAGQAKELLEIGKRRLADSVEFIADFYCKLEIYHACAHRFIQLADQYPEYADLRIKALDMAAMALEKLAEQKEKDPESDKNLFVKSMSPQELRERAANFRRLKAQGSE